MKSRLLFFLAFLFIIPFANAAPPISFGDVTEGFVLKYPSDQQLKLNLDYTFEFHTFNVSNGAPIVAGASCYFHLYNQTGNHMLTLNDAAVSNDYDYEFLVKGGNFSIMGDYYYIAQCNNSIMGGYVEVPFQITQSGDSPIEQSKTVTFALILFFIISFFCFMGFVSFSNNLYKWMFFYLGVLFMVLGINLVGISLRNEMVASNITTFFDNFGAVMFYVLWFIGGLLFVIWAITTIADIANRSTMRKAQELGEEADEGLRSGRMW